MSIITNIKLKNFYNYYGTNNYAFKKGLNVIVADNGGGKSKLLNAIKWVLEDIVYEENGKEWVFINTRNAIKLISDRAKGEAKENGRKVEAVVEIEYVENEDTKDIYVLKKKIVAVFDQDNKDWGVTVHGLRASMKSEFDSGGKIFSEVTKYKEKLIPGGFRPYLIFRGEGLADIINTQSPKSLRAALKTIADVEHFNEYIERLRSIKERKERIYKRKMREQASNENELKLKEEKVKELEKEIDDYKEQKANLEEEIAIAEQKVEGGRLEFELADKINEQLDALKRKKAEYSKLSDKYDKHRDDVNKNFFLKREFWVLLNTEHVFERFRVRMDEFKYKIGEAKHNSQEAKKRGQKIYKLPPNSPDYGSLKKMVEEEICLVCRRDAKKGSDAYLEIEALLERNTKSSGKSSGEENLHKNDFSDFFEYLYVNGASLQRDVQGVEAGMSSFDKKKGEMQRGLIKIKEDIELLKDNLRNYGVDDSDPNKKNYREIYEAHEHVQRDLVEYRQRLKSLKTNLQAARTALQRAKEDIKKIQEWEGLDNLDKAIEVMSDALKVLEFAKEYSMNSLIGRLEESANEMYIRLTKYNPGVKSKLLFEKKDDNRVLSKIVNEQGEVLNGLAQGFQDMRRLATIMGIIKAAQSYKMSYPFIADAPLSTFGEGFVRGFLETGPKVFSQMIIASNNFIAPNKSALNPKPELNSLGENVLQGFLDGSYEGTMYINGRDADLLEGESVSNINAKTTIIKKI